MIWTLSVVIWTLSVVIWTWFERDRWSAVRGAVPRGVCILARAVQCAVVVAYIKRLLCSVQSVVVWTWQMNCCAVCGRRNLHFGRYIYMRHVVCRILHLNRCCAICRLLWPIFRVGQNHIYTVYIRWFGLGNHQIYGVYIRFWPTLLIFWLIQKSSNFSWCVGTKVRLARNVNRTPFTTVCSVSFLPKLLNIHRVGQYIHCICIGLARTIYIRCTYGIFGLEITKYTVYIYGSGLPYECMVNNYELYYMTVCMVVSLLKTPYVHRIYL